MTMRCLSYSEFDSDAFAVPFFRSTSSDWEGLADELEEEMPSGPMIVDAKVAPGDREQELHLVQLVFHKVTLAPHPVHRHGTSGR